MLAYSGAFGSVEVLSSALQGAATHDRGGVARETLLRQQFAQFHLDQFQQLRVIHLVNLVQVDHDARHFHLARQQHMLVRLRHGPIRGGHHQDGAIHLRGTRDHVLDVVTVTGHVHVGIVTLVRLVFHVGDVDRDAARLLFRRIVNRVVRTELRLPEKLTVLRDRRRQRGLAMVNVTHRAHVHVRFRCAYTSASP